MNLAMAVGMHKVQIREVVRATMVLGTDMMDVQILAVFEQLVTDRTQTLLPTRELPRAVPQRLGSAPPLSPIVLEGRVVRGIGLGDEPMPRNPCPGEFPEGGMALCILKDPPVSSGFHGPAPILLGSPPA
jgi:hypothetical protein